MESSDPDVDPDVDSDVDSDQEPGETQASPAAADDGTVAADVGVAQPRAGRAVRRWILAGGLALVLAVAAYEGWLLFAQHQQDAAAAAALAAAERYTLALTSVDPNAIDKSFTEVLDGATGDFKRMYTQSSEQLRQLLVENKAAAHGTVIDAGIKSATKNKVEVMLFVDQSVSNKAAPGPQIDRSRIVMTMEKVDGRWLASKVELP